MEQSICRTCLAESNESIFKTIFLEKKELELVEMLNECTGLKVAESDEISLNICDICTETIIKYYVYRKKCWESQSILFRRLEENDIANNSVKCESENDSESEITYAETSILTDMVENELAEETVGLGEIKTESHDNMTYSCTNLVGEHLRDERDILEYQKPQCTYCKKTLRSMNSLRRHIFDIHESPKIKVKYCKYCKKPFHSFYEIRRHIVDMHGTSKIDSDADNCICDLCGLKLKNRRNLDIHMRRHTGEKPYKCDLCEYRAAQQSCVTIHRRTHTKERSFGCDICGNLFRTSSAMRDHRLAHSDEAPLECIVCKKRFKKRKIYKEHMIIHDPDKYVACEFCGKKFARKDNLNTHIKQHTGEKPHVCEYCGKGFVQKHCWKTHLKNHHSQ